MLLFALIGMPVVLASGGPDGDGLSKVSINDDYDFISINSILMWMSNNGDMAFNPLAGQSGLEWPKGSSKQVIFEDGLIIGGLVQGEIRIAGSTYRHGFQAGKILPDGTAADPADSRYRIFKVRKITRKEFAKLEAADQEQLRKDFMEWPVADGARYTDKNGNGTYDPDFEQWLDDPEKSDEPWFIGDEVLWFVSNDLDPSRTNRLYGTGPIGLEVQTMVWGYNQTGPLGNMVFTKYTVINRGNDDLEQAYFAKWSDPDLGDANDDLVGIDTVTSLGYVYNGYAKDGVYGVPPAAGYDFFQGPIVPEAGSVANYNFGKREGFKNLPVSSFAYYINGDPIYRDPPLGTGYQEMYYYLQGFLWNGSPYIDPTTQLQTKFTLAGDPITKTGWIDGMINSPADRRFLMTAGPFTLAKGDTQEVVVASIVGRGSDRLSSLQVIRYYDRFAQVAFDNNFNLPQAPPTPNVSATLLPNKILLYWGDQQQADAIEKFNDQGYKFQGYNVYQFRFPDDPFKAGKRLATYDIVDNVATIFDEVVDENSGAVVSLPVQFGTDSGIKRFYEVLTDAIKDRPLVNNQPYYFAVTAYSYNDDENVVPRVLESSPKIIEVRPQFPNPGTRFNASYKSFVTVTHESGQATGEVKVQVIDPLALTGHKYAVTFESLGKVQSPYDIDGDGTPDETLELDNYGLWNLTDETAGRAVVTKSDNFGGLDVAAYTVDGFMLGVTGSGYYVQNADDPQEVLRVEWEGGTNPFEPWWHNWFLPGWWFFGSSIKGYEITQTVEIRFDRNNRSKGYSFPRGGSFGYAYKGYYESPITVWDVSDPNNERQISYAWSEQSGGAFDNDEWMPGNGLGDREYLYILNIPYSDTPDPTLTQLNILRNGDQFPVLYAGWFQRRAGFKQPDPAGEKSSQSYPWQDGAVWRIVPNLAFSSNDRFVFTTAAPTEGDVELAKQDIEEINVFPNPYVGANDQERNKYQRFVTFNHLPQRATIRVFTLSGTLVQTIEKDDPSQLATWDLRTESSLPVGAGMYIIHIDMPDLGVEKVLKLAVIHEAQFLDRI